MRLLIVTDAWAPQTNGVVRTLATVIERLRALGHEVHVVHPGLFATVPCPTYPDIRLALLPGRRLRATLRELAPDAVHVATEGPLGIAARRLLVELGLPFTTAFHTRFAEYVHERARIPLAWTYRGLRWFHGAAERVLVATQSLQEELEGRGFRNVARWSRGVDLELFRPDRREDLGLARPVHAYVGRVAVEKNLEAFLSLDLPGSKLVVGDGPSRRALERRWPAAVFVGMKHGEELARHYASSDVFVFPSRTDTFGLVVLEALACGVPVAAFPVPGPLDVLGDAPVGALREDLGEACRLARAVDPAACRRHAEGFSWERCAELLLAHLAPISRAA